VSLLERLRSRLLLKFALATLVVIGFFFSIATVLNARKQRAVFEDMNRSAAEMFTESTIAGVRSAMLTGDPIAVRRLIDDVRHRLRRHEIHVYDRRGYEVFAPPGPPPRPGSLPAPLRSALAGRPTREDGGVHVPIPNEERCRPCHEASDLRGVLTLRPSPDGDRVASAREVDVEAKLVGLAFEQMMAAKRSEDLTPFFDELGEVTEQRVSVAVLDVAGEVKFGALPLTGTPEHEVAVPNALLDGLLRRDLATHPFVDEDLDLRFVPLPNLERCHSCHEPETGPMRGAIVVGVRHLAGPDVARATIDRSLRWIMLSGLGRLVMDYLERAKTEAHLSALALHDSAGRLYHEAGLPARPPAAVRRVLHGGTPVMDYVGDGADQAYLAIEPLANDTECMRCHGTDHAIRGVVQIVSPTGKEAKALAAQIQYGGMLGLATVVFVFAFLYVATKRIVLDPVQHIGDVADAVGQGRLDRETQVASADEIGRLGRRINEMIRGLRERLQLQKFVSGPTRDAVKGGAEVGLGSRRRRVTVFFSDIRGFTAYSERTEPEKVVKLLNEYLHVQTDLVHRHGGDVDKYVGDEIFAVFEDTAAAIRCGLDAVEAVEAITQKGGDDIGIGVGINEGDVLLGAIGHHDRMDFTVIGDVVNTGARICAAAPRGTVYVSGAAHVAAHEAEGIVFEATPPIVVKGKSEPLEVWTARRRA
jgi:adenylate cyclase